MPKPRTGKSMLRSLAEWRQGGRRSSSSESISQSQSPFHEREIRDLPQDGLLLGRKMSENAGGRPWALTSRIGKELRNASGPENPGDGKQGPFFPENPLCRKCSKAVNEARPALAGRKRPGRNLGNSAAVLCPPALQSGGDRDLTLQQGIDLGYLAGSRGENFW